MRDLDETQITQAVIARFADTPDPRLRELVEGLVDCLHDYVRQVRLTPEEWATAIDFLTRTGEICTDKRQEFILLSDTLGVSTLVDAMANPVEGGATESTVLGPFFVADAPELANGVTLAGSHDGEPLLVSGQVVGPDGAPLAGVRVDIWHADDEGLYDVQIASLNESLFRGRVATDSYGRFQVWTIVPRYYPIPHDGPVGEMLAATRRHPNRPAHIHFMIAADGFRRLTTHLFDERSPYLDGDAVFGVKSSLIRPFVLHGPGEAPDGTRMHRDWRHLDYRFELTVDTSSPD